MTDYEKIESAIHFIRQQSNKQPSLEDIASHVHLSSFHFQKLFSQWAGISPKRFLQALTLDNAKQLVRNTPASLLELSEELGLSSSSRLYDHFVNLEAMTPAEYKQMGNGVYIRYGVGLTPYGVAFIAQTSRGICKLAFMPTHLHSGIKKKENLTTSFVTNTAKELQNEWPKAQIVQNNEDAQTTLKTIFNIDFKNRSIKKKPLSLFVKGTNFQVNVWRALIRIQSGDLASYNHIAAAIGKPKANRAVGTAIGNNPVAILIPCHRVIRQSGDLGGYRWGIERKHALIASELAHIENNE